MGTENNIQKELLLIIKKRWLSYTGLLAALFFELLGLCPYFWNNFGKGIEKKEWIVISILVLITVLLWLFGRKYPRNQKDKTGVVIAIKTENKKQHSRLRSDLISGLRDIIKIEERENFFNIIELPEYYAVQVTDLPSARKALKKSRSHFLMFGSCKVRLEKGKEFYYISLEAGVMHKPIPRLINDVFAKEFREVFPRKLIFPVDDEISGFEITKSLIGLSSRYIIGIAAFLSLDFKLSFEIFKKIHKEIKNFDVDKVQVKKIKSRIPKWLSVNSLTIAQKKYYLYRKEKNESFLKEMKPFLDILKEVDPNNYDAHLLRAIYLFLTKRNVGGALKEIKASKNNLDHTWRYSEAFLYAYMGNMDKAEEGYRKAFRSDVHPGVVLDTEEFIYDILKAEPNKYQLWYCLAIINWKDKKDKVLAREAFEKFINFSNNGLFMRQKRKAKDYLKELASQ